jgi:hypothetical protein
LVDSIKGKGMSGDRIELVGVGDNKDVFFVSKTIHDIQNARSLLTIPDVSYFIDGTHFGRVEFVPTHPANYFLKPKTSTLLQEIPKNNPHEMIDLSLMNESFFRMKYFR